MKRSEFQQEHGIIGESAEMQELVDVVRQVAPSDITVLITGESGVGKEVIAKAIHKASKRADRPMISVNCGAIPEGIIESELFGHEKGAFTGASEMRKGYFELADGGTIFLDEIGELPLGTQVKFLRVLENGEFMRVGSPVPRTVDVRVIAATNKELEPQVRKGNFRADLFFRLRSINIHVPPLRERREDIPVFVEYFAKEISGRNGIDFHGFSPEAMELLKGYRWDGNVRELRNVVESMIVLEQGKLIKADDVRKYVKGLREDAFERNLPVHLHKTTEQAERELIYRALLDMKNDIVQIKNFLSRGRTEAIAPLDDIPFDASGTAVSGEVVESREEDSVSLDEMERRMITNALRRFNGNRRMAASSLNISERTLYRKIKEYGLNGT
jgi:DNA-binding NtrC family response regulator